MLPNASQETDADSNSMAAGFFSDPTGFLYFVRWSFGTGVFVFKGMIGFRKNLAAAGNCGIQLFLRRKQK